MKTPFDHLEALIRAFLKEEKNAGGAWESFEPIYDQLEAQRKAEAETGASLKPEPREQDDPLPQRKTTIVASFSREPSEQDDDDQFKGKIAVPVPPDTEPEPWVPFPTGEEDFDPDRRRK